MNSPAIVCEGLTRRYGEVLALDNLNLEVPAGTIFGFLGRNGAGKTTTIRLLTGLAHPTAGRAWVGGIETTSGESAARRQFGYLPQAPAFYKWMSANEYLAYAGKLFGMPGPQRKQRIAQVLDLVGLSSAARRRIGGFSGGMLQRLGIAQAFLHEPAVLLLDEPTSALDPAGRYEVLELMERLRGQVTIFFSTHILADVERVCDAIAIVHKGRLLLVSERQELLKRYPINTLEVDFEPPAPAALPAFIEALHALPYIANVSQENGSVRITTSDLVAARAALLPLLVQYDLNPLRYAWVRPTIEEIFLQISAE